MTYDDVWLYDEYMGIFHISETRLDTNYIPYIQAS